MQVNEHELSDKLPFTCSSDARVYLTECIGQVLIRGRERSSLYINNTKDDPLSEVVTTRRNMSFNTNIVVINRKCYGIKFLTMMGTFMMNMDFCHRKYNSMNGYLMANPNFCHNKYNRAHDDSYIYW